MFARDKQTRFIAADSTTVTVLTNCRSLHSLFSTYTHASPTVPRRARRHICSRTSVFSAAGPSSPGACSRTLPNLFIHSRFTATYTAPTSADTPTSPPRRPPSPSVSSSSCEPEPAVSLDNPAPTGAYQRPSHARQRSSFSSSSMSSGSALCTPGVPPLADDSPDFADLEADVLALPSSAHMHHYADPSTHKHHQGREQSAENPRFALPRKKAFGLSYARRPSATNTRSTIPVPMPLTALSPSSSQSRHSSMSNSHSHSRHRPLFIRDPHLRIHSAPVNVLTFASEDEATSSSHELKDTDVEDALSQSLRGLLSASSHRSGRQGSRPSSSNKVAPGVTTQLSPIPPSPTLVRFQSNRTRHDSQATLTGVNLNGTLKPKRVSLPAGFASLMQVGAEVGKKARARGLAHPPEAVQQKGTLPTYPDLEKVSSHLALWKLKMGDRLSSQSRSRSRSRSRGRASSPARHEWYPADVDGAAQRGRPTVRQGRDFSESVVARLKPKDSMASTEPLFGLNGFGVLGDGFRRSDRETDLDRPRGQTESRGRARCRWDRQEVQPSEAPEVQDRGRRRERTLGIGLNVI